MPPVQLRTYSSLAGSLICSSCRRHTLDLTKQPGLRPLHASPIFQKPRRREFFSSNAALASLRDSHSSKQEEAETLQARKRKHGGAAAAKISLRRVAVEAQRTKDGSLSLSSTQYQQSTEGAATPRLVTAYAVAERFNLAKVVEILRSKGYEPDPLSTGLYPQVVHVQVPISSIYRSSNPSARDLTSSEIGDIFVFPSGTVVTWALPEGFTSYFVTRTLMPAAEQPHTDPIETEDLDFLEESTREHSMIRGETIILGTKPPSRTRPQTPSLNTDDTHSNSGYQTQSVDTVLTKIAFSSGFARSTKLAILETSLSTYLASTAQIPQLLSSGRRLPFAISRRFILRKTGELLLLRAQLNLYSELTDSLPDLFWDSRHELNLESYYDQVGKALDVGIRIKLLNEKMDYAGEIATVLRERLSEKHGLFLEWTIIVLIAIEVGFEILRLWKEGFWSEVFAREATSSRSSDSASKKPLFEEVV